jgi:transposase-like protein
MVRPFLLGEPHPVWWSGSMWKGRSCKRRSRCQKLQPNFTAEFKQEAVQLVLTSDKPKAQIARELGISDNALSSWCAREDAPTLVGRERVGAQAWLRGIVRASETHLLLDGFEHACMREHMRKRCHFAHPGRHDRLRFWRNLDCDLSRCGIQDGPPLLACSVCRVILGHCLE